jgi:hypothetical protein
VATSSVAIFSVAVACCSSVAGAIVSSVAAGVTGASEVGSAAPPQAVRARLTKKKLAIHTARVGRRKHRFSISILLVKMKFEIDTLPQILSLSRQRGIH